MMMMTIESLHHEILDESAFDIASSMIQSDLSFNSQSALSALGSPSFRNTGLDYSDAKLDEDILFQSSSNCDISVGVCNNTRLRRRKASQPQRLVYCDLDFLAEDFTQPINAGSVTDPLEFSDLNSSVNSEISNTNSEIVLESASNAGCNQILELASHSSPEPLSATDEEYRCDVCDAICPTKTKLKNHKRSHVKGKDKLSCEICGKKFQWLYSWKTHVQAHREDNPNKCTECGMKFFNKFILQNHIRRIHEKTERTFSCELCPKRFLSKQELIQHGVSHSVDKAFSCKQCGKAFTCQRYLEKHVKTHIGLKKYKCDHCDREFADKTGFTAHVRAHLGERPYACDMCEKSYTIKAHLTSHKLSHSDDRPFECKECGKTFKSRSNLRTHKDSHLGVKRWSCKHCGKSFLSQGNMIKHVRRHAGEKKHKCMICSKSFYEKQELAKHSKTHSKVTPGTVDLPKQFTVNLSDAVSVPPLGSELTLSTPALAPAFNVIETLESAINPAEHIQESSNLIDLVPVSATDSQICTTNHNPFQDFTASVIQSDHYSEGAVTLLNPGGPSLSFVNCSLCSNVYLNHVQLRDHLVEYHRVEVDKVVSGVY
ncbi:Zinc finger protein [Halotydeus destructor]|nr:Zinc finger protein [Halotydeus destructor]